MIRKTFTLRMPFWHGMRAIQWTLLNARCSGARSLPGLRLDGAAWSGPGTALPVAAELFPVLPVSARKAAGKRWVLHLVYVEVVFGGVKLC